MTRLFTKNKGLTIFITVLLLFTSTTFFSQTKDDYSVAIESIKKGFNDSNASLIYEKFDADLKSVLDKDSLEKLIVNLRKENGKMISYEFILDDDKEKNYLVEFESTSMLIVLVVKNTGEISTFKIKDY